MNNFLPHKAEGMRFELMVPCGTHAFQACALDHYANPPLYLGLRCTIQSLRSCVNREQSYAPRHSAGPLEAIYSMKLGSQKMLHGFEDFFSVRWFKPQDILISFEPCHLSLCILDNRVLKLD